MSQNNFTYIFLIVRLCVLGPPSKPTGPVGISDLTKTSAKLSWKPPTSDGGAPLTGYIIKKKEGKRTTWARCGKISPDETSYNVKNLTEGTEYLFRVTAENKLGVSPALETDKSVVPKSEFGRY